MIWWKVGHILKIEYTLREEEYLIENCRFNEENGELEVFKLRNKGNSIVSIAVKLSLSPETVKRRIKSIKRKIIKVTEM